MFVCFEYNAPLFSARPEHHYFPHTAQRALAMCLPTEHDATQTLVSRTDTLLRMARVGATGMAEAALCVPRMITGTGPMLRNEIARPFGVRFNTSMQAQGLLGLGTGPILCALRYAQKGVPRAGATVGVLAGHHIRKAGESLPATLWMLGALGAAAAVVALTGAAIPTFIGSAALSCVFTFVLGRLFERFGPNDNGMALVGVCASLPLLVPLWLGSVAVHGFEFGRASAAACLQGLHRGLA